VRETRGGGKERVQKVLNQDGFLENQTSQQRKKKNDKKARLAVTKTRKAMGPPGGGVVKLGSPGKEKKEALNHKRAQQSWERGK